MMDNVSIMMEDADRALNQRIAERAREFRLARGLSIESLASRSGVSRSMISLIERGESSPTAAVLAKLATGLGILLSELFEEPDPNSDREPISRRAEQPEWKDPASNYCRRNITPPHIKQPMQIVEVHFPPGERVTFENAALDSRVYQQIWMLEGTMAITLVDTQYMLSEGDCLAMELDRLTIFENPTREPARYAVVVFSERKVSSQ